METFGLVLGLVKVSLEIFKDERKGRFLKKYNELVKEWNEEMSRPEDERSDLALDNIMFKCEQLASSVITESGKL